MLLYYLPIALEGLIEEKLLKHFNLYSASIYILLKTQITTQELHAAGQMLTDFADQFEKNYGAESITMNIHLLRHYQESVQNSGPLWANSMFAFESNNGVLCKAVKNNPTDEIDTISFNYCLWRSEKKCVSANVLLLRSKLLELPENIATILRQKEIKPKSENKFFVADAIKVKTQHYTSTNSKTTKSIDYFIEMKDGSIGSVYIYMKFNDDVYLVLEQYAVTEKMYHLQKIKPLGTFNVYSFDDISCKLLYLKFPNAEAIAKEPNYYET